MLLPSSCRYCSNPPAKQESKESSSSILINRLSTGFPSQQTVKGHFSLGLRLFADISRYQTQHNVPIKTSGFFTPRPIKCISRKNCFPFDQYRVMVSQSSRLSLKRCRYGLLVEKTRILREKFSVSLNRPSIHQGQMQGTSGPVTIRCIETAE